MWGWGLGNFLKHEFSPLWVMHDFFWWTIAYKRSFFNWVKYRTWIVQSTCSIFFHGPPRAWHDLFIFFLEISQPSAQERDWFWKPANFKGSRLWTLKTGWWILNSLYIYIYISGFKFKTIDIYRPWDTRTEVKSRE